MKKKLLSLALALALCLGLAVPAFAEDGLASAASSNLGNNDYGIAASTVRLRSYLFKNSSGGLTRVEYIPLDSFADGDAQVVVEDYDSQFQITASRTIPMELPRWGGFYAGENYNYFFFGRTNKLEKDNIEVIRVVKYSKSWERLGQASIYGANTVTPFSCGLRYAEYGGYLYVHTSHSMYTASDGGNHEANMSFAVRINDMTVTDCRYSVGSPQYGSVHHSLDQYVLVDQEQNLVTLDLGDSTPRGLVLMTYNDIKAGGESFSGLTTQTLWASSPLKSNGTLNYETSVGGLAETYSGYVSAYNYDETEDDPEGTPRDIFLAYISKDSRDVTIKKLSLTSRCSTPHLVSTGLDGGYILWNHKQALRDDDIPSDTLYYVRYSDKGEVGQVQTVTAPLSDCLPILYNGKLVWYVTDNSAPVFYTLDESGVKAVKTSRFADVSISIWYADAVQWAVEKEVTEGTGNNMFSPDNTCTHAEILAFIHRAVAKNLTVSNWNLWKSDLTISEDMWYYEDINWATYANIVPAPYSQLNVDAPCTRAEAMLYLYRAKGKGTTAVYDGRFADVPADAEYAQAVAWAVEQGITQGVDSTHFDPDATCTRAEIVTFLYRALA